MLEAQNSDETRQNDTVLGCGKLPQSSAIKSI
jgi:hypothetical protein